MTKQTAQPLKVVTMGELMAHDFPRRHYLLTPWLRQGESVLLWADAGLGKTMLTLTMVLAIAGGGAFLGWRSDTSRRVLVMDGEMHAEDLKDRLALLFPTVAGLDRTAAGENLRLLSRQFQGGGTEFPDLAARDGQDTIMQHIAQLIILDNFAALAEVPDENEAVAMSPVLTFLLRLKQANVACILVHHSGKTGSTYRGSSKLATTFEVVLGLKRHDNAVVGTGASFETEWTKFSGAPHEAVRAAVVALELNAAGRLGWASQPAECDAVRQVLVLVRSGKHSSQKELAAALGVSEGQITKLKGRAIREQRITNEEWKECLAGAYAANPTAAF